MLLAPEREMVEMDGCYPGELCTRRRLQVAVVQRRLFLDHSNKKPCPKQPASAEQVHSILNVQHTDHRVRDGKNTVLVDD